MKVYIVLIQLWLTALLGATVSEPKCQDFIPTYLRVCSGLAAAIKPTMSKIKECQEKCEEDTCKRTCARQTFEPALDKDEVKLAIKCTESTPLATSELASCANIKDDVAKSTVDCFKKCSESTCKFECSLMILEARRNEPKSRANSSAISATFGIFWIFSLFLAYNYY